MSTPAEPYETTLAALVRLEQRRNELLRERERCALLRAELASARTELDAVRTARDNLDRQLAAARTEIADLDRQVRLCPRCGIELNADLSGGTPALASWIVARDGGRNCERCEQEIRRGEAYELAPGTGGLMQHIHCRDAEPRNDGPAECLGLDMDCGRPRPCPDHEPEAVIDPGEGLLT